MYVKSKELVKATGTTVIGGVGLRLRIGNTLHAIEMFYDYAPSKLIIAGALLDMKRPFD
jgi:hypothetical protein